MDRLLPVFNRLQEALSSCQSDAAVPPLPQIVVVGAQSAGKSSVLEGLVGREFLPRGAGIVTRRPLLLQLVHADEEYGEFMHLPGKRFECYDAIRAEIEAETARMLGHSKRVSSEPIRLRLYSPHVLDLALVDLPGLTKVPVQDQPADIEQQLRAMVLEYASNPACIILAVSSATSDLATSDAMQIARRVDPKGERTMGVITKLDLMDDGTDAAEVLRNQVIPLSRGYVGVVNRSQRDINEHKPLGIALASEHAFFETHPVYSRMAPTLGTAYLARRMNEILLAHVRASLPELARQLSGALAVKRAELESYGEPLLQGRPNRGAMLLQLITAFCNNFGDAIDGTSAHVQEIARDRGELYGGARINHLFRVEYFDELQNVDACAGLSDADISHAIRQATGPRAPLFVPEVAFEVLTRRQVAQLRPYALRAVEQVLAEMQAMVSACMPKQAARFSTLQKRITQCATRLLARHAAPTNSMVASLVDMELAYLNTSHPDFVGGGQAMRLVAQQMHSSANTRFQSAEVPINPFSESSTAKHGSVNSASGGASSLDLARPPELPQVEPRRSSSVGDESSSFLNSFFGNGRSRNSAVTAALAPPPAPTVGLSSCASGEVRGDGAGGSNSSLADSYAERHNGHFHCTPRTAPSREHLEAEIIRSLLVSYFGIVRKNLQDLVPKAIMHFLVNAARSEMQNNLVAELYREHELDSMFAEAEEVVEERQKCAEVVKALERALEVVRDLREARYDC